jgi:hypothetical protein
MEQTGFCWGCGRPCEGLFCRDVRGKTVYASKCQRTYENVVQREQERGIKRGKRAGYGVAGSTY